MKSKDGVVKSSKNLENLDQNHESQNGDLKVWENEKKSNEIETSSQKDHKSNTSQDENPKS